MQKLLTGVFSLLLSTTALAYNFDRNVPENIKNQMIEDLNFVTSVTGEQQSGLHRDIFGPLNGTTYKQFFDQRIRSIGKNGCGSPNAVACVIPFIPNKMFITDNYIRFSHPQIARLMVVFHESRHTESENGNWAHASCPVPFVDENGKEFRSIWTGASLAGEAACDETPHGSYGSSSIMLKNISKFCTSCNDKVKMDAGLYADDQLNRIVDARAKKDMIDDVFGN